VSGGGEWDGDGLMRQLQESFSAIAMSRVIPAFQTEKQWRVLITKGFVV
jgi:hypothetical protein